MRARWHLQSHSIKKFPSMITRNYLRGTVLIWQYFDYNMSPIKMSRLLEILDTFVRGSFVPSYLRS